MERATEKYFREAAEKARLQHPKGGNPPNIPYLIPLLHAADLLADEDRKATAAVKEDELGIVIVPEDDDLSRLYGPITTRQTDLAQE